MGKTTEAIEIASSLIRVMPTNVTGHVVRARALESQGEFREALASWRHARDLLPNSPLIQKGLRRTAEKMTRVVRQASDDLSDAPLVDNPNDEPGRLSDDLTTDVSRGTAGDIGADAAVSFGGVKSDDLTVSHDPVSDDLDGLIAELEDARIKPSDRAFPTPDLDSPIENVATETLARIFAEQKQFDEAARVYDRLADLRPDHRDEFLQRAVEMRERADRT